MKVVLQCTTGAYAARDAPRPHHLLPAVPPAGREARYLGSPRHMSSSLLSYKCGLAVVRKEEAPGPLAMGTLILVPLGLIVDCDARPGDADTPSKIVAPTLGCLNYPSTALRGRKLVARNTAATRLFVVVVAAVEQVL